MRLPSSRETTGGPAGGPAGGRGGLLVVGVNWVGDTVMAMPALAAWRAAEPGRRLLLLAREHLLPLWRLHGAADALLPWRLGAAGTAATLRAVRAQHPDRAVVFPRSFRSAFVPWRAGVPEREGPPGHVRDALLTRVIDPHPAGAASHQAFEYYRLLGLPCPEAVPTPRLVPPAADVEAVRSRFGAVVDGGPVGLVPGAARGPSKRWPARRFAETGRRLAARTGRPVVVMGAASERELCGEVAAAAGPGAVNAAGRTTLTEWVALLRCCRVVVTNDSGGMHLAAAAGAPVVAVFGATDPDRTGPLSGRAAVVQAAGERDRAIGRRDVRGERALAAVSVEAVLARCLAAGDR